LRTHAESGAGLDRRRRQFRQLGDVGGDAPCLVAGEQLGRRAPFLGQKQVSASGKVVVSDLEGFVLFFEQTGQLLDRPSTAGQVGWQLR
jgi:hypothetical protein